MKDRKKECSIFYLDDDADDLELFGFAAESIGEEVCLFHIADLMFFTLENPPPTPSIVFVDLNMPLISGFRVIAKIRATPQLAHLPVVAYSTSNSPKDISRARNAGASLYVVKPDSLSEVREIISRVLNTNWEAQNVSGKKFIFRKDMINTDMHR